MDSDYTLTKFDINHPVEGKKPWDIFPTETIKEYEAFLHFLKSKDRTFSATCKFIKLNPNKIYQLASKYKWRERCEAFDLWELQEVIKRESESRIKAGCYAMEIAKNALAPMNKVFKEGSFENLTEEEKNTFNLMRKLTQEGVFDNIFKISKMAQGVRVNNTHKIESVTYSVKEVDMDSIIDVESNEIQ